MISTVSTEKAIKKIKSMPEPEGWPGDIRIPFSLGRAFVSPKNWHKYAEVEDIFLDDKNLTSIQKSVDKEQIIELVKLGAPDIKPLPLVTEFPNGTMLIEDGNHRLAAKKFLGHNTAKVRLIKVSNLPKEVIEQTTSTRKLSMRLFKQLIESVVTQELQRLTEKLNEVNIKRAADYIEWLKGLKSSQSRPTGWKVARLKKEKIGKSCAFCDEETLVGVEHIIPRSLGGPKFDRWNLAWSCYPCNDARGSSLGLPVRNVPMIGWLGEALSNYDELPTEEDILGYFKSISVKEQRFNNIVKEEVVDENSDPLYHVTYYNRLPNIASSGLKAGMDRSIGGPSLDTHSAQGTFLSEDDGVSFWHSRAEEFAEHKSDNFFEDGLIPVVLRVRPGGFNEDDLIEDKPGSDDSMTGAYIYPRTIKSNFIDVWDGSSWVPVSNYEQIDIEQAIEIDEEGDEQYIYFNSSTPLLP